MGQEVNTTRFKRRDFERFAVRLKEETALLRQWFEEDRFAKGGAVGGLELEAWLVDGQLRPAPANARYLEQLHDARVVPELAQFNVELNVASQGLRNTGLRYLEQELQGVWQRCDEVARAQDMALLGIGILPTLADADLSPVNMSSMKRFKALNEQVLRSRHGEPLVVNITGRDHLEAVHNDVMLESAATSLQVHLQVPAKEARRAYNAAVIASAPLVAVAANSPYLFGKDLWDETRIPVFEQAVDVGGFWGAARGPVKRVTFGSGYVQHSLMECFSENMEHYPVLLPIVMNEPADHMAHVRLHNGTLWRWNRPLIGFDDDGEPHLRIEHRVMPAGPTVVDEIANCALFFGLAESLARRSVAPEAQLPFPVARDNFYAAARSGLETHVTWLDGQRLTVSQLVARELLPMARQGLEQLAIDEADIARYLGIIEARIRNGCNGAVWQRAFVARYGPDMTALTRAYLARQRSGIPVHEWDL